MARTNDRAAARRTGPERWREPGAHDGPSGPLPARERSVGLPPTRRRATPQGRSVDTIRVRDLFG